ncbi:MAG: ABC transporter permease [Flavobacteriales bacterium]|nr:ABC transporter permease [Flavobacteriales bacterium]MDG1780812.1 ABC transporter permease [Flavobacteriales bacterium]MDG2245683.1 ABC transporter permease [Flavobacteriales bacterium]
MISFLLRRSIYGITVLFGVVTLVFFLFGLVPDPARELAGQTESEEVIQAIRVKYNLDLSLGHRYLLFINDVSPLSLYANNTESRRYRSKEEVGGFEVFSGDDNKLVLKAPYLGRSYLTDRSVSAILKDAFPGTLVLALVAMLFAMIIGILLGLWSALNEGTWIDRMILLTASVGMSGPSFFMAILIAWIGGFLLYDSVSISLWIIVLPLLAILVQRMVLKRKIPGLFTGSIVLGTVMWIGGSKVGIPAFGMILPGTGLPMNGSLYTVDVWKGEQLALKNLILPALTLGIRPLAVVAQLMRNSVLEVKRQDFVRTARAKGLSEVRIMSKHILRNALNPVLTAASGWLASMLAGAVFVEFVFGWKGMGLEVFRSLEKNDLPVVMGAVMVIAVLFVIINTLVDLVYGWIDPRVRLN